MVRTLAAVAALAVGLTAAHAQTRSATKSPGTLDVFDAAKLFTPDGVAKAKEKLRGTGFHHGLTVTVDTAAEVPAEKKAAAEAASHDAAKWRAFLLDWARENAKHDRAKGIYVLVTTAPVGGVAVLADRETTDRGFTPANDEKVRDILVAAFKEAKAETNPAKQQEIRSAGLLKAVEFIAADLKDTRVTGAFAGGPAPAPHREAAGGGIGGYICMGLFALAGVWLVIGLIRMFTGGGGGGSGMGGGGGGFMTSLFGGLFGAVAGMWLYNSMFGGGGMFGGSDAYAGDAGAGAGGDAGNTGAGDWDGGGGSAGGFDGGDAGGGGGDFGGDF